MSTDSGAPIQPRQTRQPVLPGLRSLDIRRVEVTPPEHTHFRSSLPRGEAVEFLAELDGDVPARAYGPALFVGDVEVDQSERIGPTTWRFLAQSPETLTEGAPISVGWMKDPSDARRETEFRYRIS